MRINQIKFFVIAAAVLILAAVSFSAGWNRALPVSKADDIAALYKSKCAACHSPKAEKFFDPAKTDEFLVETILKGMKAAKPPNMPAFEKTVTPEQAKGLAAYMRQLRAPAAAGNENAKTETTANVATNTLVNANMSVNANVNSNACVNVNAAVVNTMTNAVVNTNVTTNANVNVNANANANPNANTTAANTTVNPDPKLVAEIAQIYKTKCLACHTAKAEKFFDPAKPDEQLAEIVLKGKKGTKPPFMPAFEEKGVSAEQAEELVKYMRKLR